MCPALLGEATLSPAVRLWRPQYAVAVRLKRVRVLIRSRKVGRDSGLYVVEAACCARPGRTDMARSRSTAAMWV